MFAKLKTGIKVMIGYAVAVAVMLVLGWVGYQGTHRLTGRIHELGMIRLPGVTALKELELSSEIVKTAQGALLNENLDPAVRQRQLENLTAARQRYQAALEIYDTLPHAPAEAKLWKKAASAWEAWDQAGAKLLQSLPKATKAGPGECALQKQLLETCRRRQEQAEAVTDQLLQLQVEISDQAVSQGQAEGAASTGLRRRSIRSIFLSC